MKILVDIIHPANVHYFKNFIFEMKKRGHKVYITSRNKDVSFKLLDAYKLKYYSTGSGSFGEGAIGKFIYIIYAEFLMLYYFIRIRPQLAISFSSTPVSHISFIFRVPHITFDDTEHAKLNRSLYLPFATKVMTPSCFTLDLGKKHIRINTYMELFYLHPNYFKPNPDIFDYLGIDQNKPFIIMRFISWKAFHDIGESGISEDQKLRLVEEFSKYAKVFITSEGDLSKKLKPYEIRLPVEKIHDALYYSSLYFGDGGTTASESAVLGVPSILISSSTTGYLTEEEERYDLLYRYTGFGNTFNEALEKGIKLLQNSKLKEEWKEKRKKLLDEKVDGTQYLINYVVDSYE